VIAYEFYWRDPIKGYQLIGTLPERRRDPRRITNESIMNWGRKFFGRNLDINGIFILQLKVDENTGETSRHNPSFISQSRNLNGNYY
jgi:hypothetical protein